MKVLCAPFLQLRFGFGKRVLALAKGFWPKKALSYEKRACQMLMKLITERLNVIPLGQTRNDDINRTITISGYYYL